MGTILITTDWVHCFYEQYNSAIELAVLAFSRVCNVSLCRWVIFQLIGNADSLSNESGEGGEAKMKAPKLNRVTRVSLV